ncbi:MAG: 2-amino-4-hydroxy-6-hydroxymethyldihydropteridine diphosphokinase, partial [Opitutaceae bacterium]
MHSAYLGIGGNLGDRLGFLTEAVRRLHRPPHTRVVTVSSVYESKPLGPAMQPDYLNAVLWVATSHSPHELLAECLRIETALGRVRRERWGPRLIDLDILLYDDVTSADAALT